jgi:alpha-tubulin suppressor-like RCC1 family protein
MTRLRWRRIALPALACGLAVVLLFPNGSPAGGAPQPEAGSSDWRQVSMGRYFACGIRTSGRLYCWGDDDLGQLGNGAATGDQPAPVLVGGGWNDWRSVSAGEGFACGLRATRAIYCWGDNSRGQLGNGTTSPFAAPTPVQGANNYWTSVTAGAFHTCGRVRDGRLSCWGGNDRGQLGTGGSGADRPEPRPVAGARTDWAAVEAGERQTCGRRTSGRLYCWGDNTYGQLGDGTTTSRPTPRLVVGGIADWRTVAVAANHTCALRASGRLYCWGSNARGQLGDGTTTTRRAPRLVPGNAVWTSVATGGRIGSSGPSFTGVTCGRRNTGRLYCWGGNATSGLGDGTTTERHVPTQVAGGATDWRTVTVGMYATCATTTGSRAYCWGYNGDGQLGTANFSGRSRPEEVWAGGSTSGNGSSGTSSGGSSGASSGGSSGTSSGGSSGASSGGSSGTSSGSSSPTTASSGPTDATLLLAVGLLLAAVAAALLDGRRWQPLDGGRDAT